MMNEEYICRCEEVSRKEIEEAIEDGARTIAGIKKRTRAGMGLCQGRTCRRLVSQMLSKHTAPEDVLPDTSRSPVRAITIREIIDGEDR